ncbi:MAG: OmpA family protein [Waddliaceae bacterium]|jgi:peptidoglycan-associated lipoprotein|nr:OmpA family protein [Waddliaceae bacterium]MBT3578728.1 OmpA family protein [Waddliaceae bacterium]MBT4444370.1 OmpA family protein [Waddliaceae bacterium]MBT6928285.1 OmpA family protein [Waddliaceae bacterium]MBT7264971.1 OmpA family protein [Waddliaceae bacterium]
MKRSLYTALVILNFAGLVLMTSCQRSSGEFLEDTKTAGRYVGKGIYSMFGKHGDSRQIQDTQEFVGPPEEDFVPLNDEGIYRQLSMGDTKALDEINVHTPIPQSKESPGDISSAIPGVDGFATPAMMNLNEVFSMITFDYNDYSITNAESLTVIKNIANYMKRNDTVYIFVEGHCDERGSSKYNLALGTRRSNSVRNLLIKEGVNLDKVFTISYGKERPIALGHDSTSMAQNRRTEFKILNKS